MKHIICYSGGHSSALVAIEVFRKYGNENLILLNHDINPNVEHEDIKRFKQQVADYIGVPVTYANMKGWDQKDQFDVVNDEKAFRTGNGLALCTSRMKTRPFHEYLDEEFPDKDCVIYYGFDANETVRIQRRQTILGEKGFKSEYPLASWERTITSTSEIGIDPPLTYSSFKHANCIGCLKAGKQHWYVVYCTRPDVWEKAKASEEKIGHTIVKNISLVEMEPQFERMKRAGVPPNETIQSQTFWKMSREMINIDQESMYTFIPLDDDDLSGKPCECVI